ncbi:MAG: RNA methyltransferase [Lachnospiraceae bacterium]|jgi:TrmH family RNA methyltransferase|nr:RNA methyltransferase [Lachnospiraceae bacterium]
MKPKTVISSSSNAQVKNLNLLQKKAKAREEQGVFVVEGRKMFEEARDAGLLVKTYACESFYQEKLQEDGAYFHDLDYEVITDALCKEISETKTPQGIMGVVTKTENSLTDILKKPDPLLLLLEDIRDPGNLGTILRTAEGAGVTGVILNRSCVDIYNPKVIRSTMGSIYRVPFYRAEDFIGTIAEIKKQSITIFAAHLLGRVYDTDKSFERGCAFLIGNEANGLSEEASQMADIRIKIPMAGKVESLNAAVAAAILMYEAARQRRNMPK